MRKERQRQRLSDQNSDKTKAEISLCKDAAHNRQRLFIIHSCDCLSFSVIIKHKVIRHCLRRREIHDIIDIAAAYGDLVQVQAALAPKLTGKVTIEDPVSKEEKTVDGTIYRGDFTASALVTPVDGIAVSVDYVLNGEDAQDDGIFGAVADINIGELLGTDFSAGVSVADRYNFEKGNDFAVTVYGGIDLIEVAVEYAYTKDEAHSLYAGIDLNLIENLGIGLYTGADDVTDYENTYYVGTDLSYTYSNITFGLGLEYAEAAAGFNYDNGGFNIVPYVSVAW